MQLTVHNYDKNRKKLEYVQTPTKPRFAPSYIISGQRADEFVKKYNEQSDDRQFQTFSISKMHRLKDAYNNKYNSTIKCTPKEMLNDKSKEIAFITRMQQHKSFQRGIKDYCLWGRG